MLNSQDLIKYNFIERVYHIYCSETQIIYTYNSNNDIPQHITIHITPDQFNDIYIRIYQGYCKWNSLGSHLVWWNNVSGITKIDYNFEYTIYDKNCDTDMNKLLFYIFSSISHMSIDSIINHIILYKQYRHFFKTLKYEIYKYTLNRVFSKKNYDFQLENSIILQFLI